MMDDGVTPEIAKMLALSALCVCFSPVICPWLPLESPAGILYSNFEKLVRLKSAAS